MRNTSLIDFPVSQVVDISAFGPGTMFGSGSGTSPTGAPQSVQNFSCSFISDPHFLHKGISLPLCYQLIAWAKNLLSYLSDIPQMPLLAP
jgi:hypothetical protein